MSAKQNRATPSGQVLLLGGTADARRAAKLLHQQGVPFVYSVAGLVRAPQVPGEVVSGGFSQFGGLEAYLGSHNITAILNATHPYTTQMTDTAFRVAQQLGMPYWRFLRPAWQQGPQDDWSRFNNWPALLQVLVKYQRVFFTAGQLPQSVLNDMSEVGTRKAGMSKAQQVCLRTAVAPKLSLPSHWQWIKAIGPFAYDDELALLKQLGTDVLVSKNSGGEATSAKLAAARTLGIKVLMLDRPILACQPAVQGPANGPLERNRFDQLEDCVNACAQWFHK